ncbi:DUF6630 family protein [Defluviitalea phaphyphila]|uniref:DUF6630 family protein n=1 Tax=Defluviitalea phaphyphila TaxID=1473580 RepID=UPI0013652779|nr:DUF6630 family protein [Defluviitalea phaphyphila]
MRWISLVSILEKNNYVCERDWKDEKEDFIYFVENLVGMKKYNVHIDPDWLNEDDFIPQWCQILDDKWKSQGVCMADFDIGSDSYVLFPCKTADLKLLQDYAAQIGERIDFAKDS